MTKPTIGSKESESSTRQDVAAEPGFGAGGTPALPEMGVPTLP